MGSRVASGGGKANRSPSGGKKQKVAGAKSTLREYAEALAVALILALFIRTFVVQAFKIPSGSMLPTLKIGDHILVNKFIYGIRIPLIGKRLVKFSNPKRGDVIVFVYPVDHAKDFIKRVVAVGGDTIEVRNKQLFVNGEQVPDPCACFQLGPSGRLDGQGWVCGAKGAEAAAEAGLFRQGDNFGPVTVPPGHLFVMGDNRDRSYDSRFWGPVSLDKVKGKAFLIYWSWNGRDRWVRWERIGHTIKCGAWDSPAS